MKLKRGRAVCVIWLAVLTTLTACGSRLPQSQIRAAQEAGVATVVNGATGNGGGSEVGDNQAAGALPSSANSGVPGNGSVITGGALPGTGTGASSGGPAGQTAAGGSSGGGTHGGTGSGSGSGSGGGLGTGSGPATGSTIVLGNIGTYSGPVGAIVVGLKQMIGVWQKWVNNHGGLNGHPVNVIIEDDQADPTLALTEAKQMVQQYHITAFFNPFLLFDFSVISQYAASVNIPIIGGDGTDPRWETTPIAFPATAPSAGVAIAGNRYAVKAGYKKIGILYCTDSPALCSPIANDVKADSTAVGASLVYNTGVSITSPSFTAQCIDAQKAGVQALWVVLDGASATRLSEECAQQNYHPQYILYGTSMQPSVASVPDLAGAIIPQPEAPPAVTNTPVTSAYHAAVNEYAPGLQLDGSVGTVWASGELIVAASKYLTANPTPAEFFKGLYEIKNDSFGGYTVPLTFTSGSHASAPNCAFLGLIKGGQLTAPMGETLIC